MPDTELLLFADELRTRTEKILVERRRRPLAPELFFVERAVWLREYGCAPSSSVIVQPIMVRHGNAKPCDGIK
jgi:hypothetical protein